MNNTTTLPAGYTEIFALDLQKNKKIALIVNGIALLIAVPMFVAGILIEPLTALYQTDSGILPMLVRAGVLFVGMFLYIILHEAVHGICMKHFVDVKIKYGFTGLYAFAGCDAYFNKRSYIIIALAPVVVWGVVLAILNCFVSAEWFWVVYFIQIMNISGAAGDIYVTCKFAKMPKDILVRDTGVAMTVYSAE